MVSYPDKLVKKRDRKEGAIKTAEEREKVLKKDYGFAVDETTKLKANYFKWLKDNGMEGFYYKP